MANPISTDMDYVWYIAPSFCNRATRSYPRKNLTLPFTSISKSCDQKLAINVQQKTAICTHHGGGTRQTAALVAFAREQQFEVPQEWVFEDDDRTASSTTCAAV